MPVMSETLIGKKSKSISFTDKSFSWYYFNSKWLNLLIFFLGGKRDQVRKDSTSVFELWIIWALHSNINLFPFSTVLNNFEVIFNIRGSGPLVILPYDSALSSVYAVYIHKHTLTLAHIYIVLAAWVKKDCMLIFILTILSKWINNTFIVVYMQLPVPCTGIKEKGNSEIPCALDTS